MNAHIKEVQNGNRTSYSQYVSRWNAPYNRDNSESIGQDGRDKEPESGIVEKEGFGPSGQGGGRTRNTIDFYVEKALALDGYKVIQITGGVTLLLFLQNKIIQSAILCKIRYFTQFFGVNHISIKCKIVKN